MSQAKALRELAEFALGDDSAIMNLAKGLSGRGVEPATIMAKQAVEAVGGNPGSLEPKPIRLMTDQPDRIPVPNKEVARDVALQSRLSTIGPNAGKLTGSNKFDIGGEPMLAKMRDSKNNKIKVQPDGPGGTKARSDGTRAAKNVYKTNDEAAYGASMKRKANAINDDLMHQAAYGDRKSIVEHDVALRAGGDNERLSISNPDFKDFKDAVEQKVYNTFGEGEEGAFVVTIDDISGGVRIIPTSTYNRFDAPSNQKGITIEMGEDIQKALKGLQKFL